MLFLSVVRGEFSKFSENASDKLPNCNVTLALNYCPSPGVNARVCVCGFPEYFILAACQVMSTKGIGKSGKLLRKTPHCILGDFPASRRT